MRSDIVEFPLRDFPIDHPSMAKMTDIIGAGPPFLVDRSTVYPAGHCYQNVLKLVSNNGGSAKFGWMIEWVPGVWAQAMHHSIWERPDGALVDCTTPQRADGPTVGSTTFISDDSIQVDTNWPATVMNKFVSLVDDADVERAIALYSENQRWIFARNEWAKSLPGARWSAAGWASTQPRKMPRKIYIGLGRSFKLLHESRRVVRDRYFG